MNKKILAIYFSDSEPMGYPFTKVEYLTLYQNLSAILSRHNVITYFVRGDSYLGSGVFSHGWSFDHQDTLVAQEGAIHADLIWNRDDKNTIPRINDCFVINNPDFDELCVDKFKTFEKFPDISPKTALIHTYQSFLELAQEWNLRGSERVVLKKNYETEGRGIVIKPVKKITKNDYLEWGDILVQEFMDSSIGIPGIVKGLHDLRITMVNGRAINSFIRTPKKGSLLANVSQGGKGTSIELEQIPDSALELVEKITIHMADYYPSVCAVDIMNTDKGYKLIELNSRPGLQHRSWSTTYLRFNQAIVEMIVMALFPVK